jgi:formate-dependent nitrite reductase membrane component NrfD
VRVGERQLDRAQEQRDGRNINEDQGSLVGEAAQQKVKLLDQAHPVVEYKLPVLGARAEAATPSPTYYDQPALKEPVWKPVVPLYFYVGGAAGASSVLSLVSAKLAGRELKNLASDARWFGAIGDLLSAGLLTYDLGKPARFLKMLRVFRPTSPMSVGSWVLAASGAANTASALFGGELSPLKPLGDGCAWVGAALGLPLAGYTAVLIGNTAVPLWQGTRRTLPFLFLSSAAVGASSLLALLPRNDAERRTLKIFCVGARIAEAVSSYAVERDAKRHPKIAEQLEKGLPAVIWKAAKVLNLAGLAVLAWPGRSSRHERIAAALGTAGALALRFGIFYAGKESARDPRATFEPQRAGLLGGGNEAPSITPGSPALAAPGAELAHAT